MAILGGARRFRREGRRSGRRTEGKSRVTVLGAEIGGGARGDDVGGERSVDGFGSRRVSATTSGVMVDAELGSGGLRRRRTRSGRGMRATDGEEEERRRFGGENHRRWRRSLRKGGGEIVEETGAKSGGVEADRGR